MPSSSVLDFEDYRRFLKARFEELKLAKPRSVSYEQVARKIGVSKTYCQYLLKGQRHLSLDKVSATARAFSLSSFEKQYLTYKVCGAATKDPEVKGFFQIMIDLMRGDQKLQSSLSSMRDTPHRPELNGSLSLLIHSMANLPNFEASADWILARLPMLGAERSRVEETLRELVERKLILRGEHGWRSSENFVQQTLARNQTAINPTFDDALFLASKAVQNLPHVKPAYFGVMAQAVSGEAQQKLVDEMIAARKKIAEIALSSRAQDPSGVDRISFGVIALFSATTPPTEAIS